MKKERYVAFCYSDYRFKTFATLEEAEKWLIDYNCMEDGVPDDFILGRDYIAKITHRSKYTITDEKSNYHVHTDGCKEDCDKEEWPYSDEFDHVGNTTLEEVTKWV